MDNSVTRNKILKKITTALQATSVPMPFPEVAAEIKSVFHAQPNDLAEIFASEFIKLGGKFNYCENELELMQNLIALADANAWQHIHCNETFLVDLCTESNLPFVKTGDQFQQMEASLTSCELAIARLGSLSISSASGSGRVLNVYCPVHICVVYASQVVWDIADATASIQAKYGEQLPSMINIATGPSRTADIEKTLVVGVHGPKEVYVMYIDKDCPY
jgi:L-lactate dehydrogenase complex protein LldG